ncbi:gamma-glutamyltransferase, partial [Rhizobium ruizarguesonis]
RRLGAFLAAERLHIRRGAGLVGVDLGGNFRGYDIISSTPPSSGGVIICEILNVLEGYPLSYLGYNSAETVNIMVEAMRYAYVDRNAELGDPDFV